MLGSYREIVACCVFFLCVLVSEGRFGRAWINNGTHYGHHAMEWRGVNMSFCIAGHGCCPKTLAGWCQHGGRMVGAGIIRVMTQHEGKVGFIENMVILQVGTNFK